MKKLTAILFHLSLLLFTFVLSAAIPQRWTVETSRLQPAQFEAYHGETIEFAAAMQTYGKPLAITNDLIGIYWQTNGMGSAYWTAPAVLSNNVMIARFTPEMDVGANVYSCFIGSPGEIYRAAFQLRLRPSPGANPSELPLPVKTLDFSQVTVLNAPYYSKSETDAKIGDMETKTHAAATYQPKGSYLTSESDPTVATKISNHNSSSTAHLDIRQALVYKYSKPTAGIPKTDLSSEVQTSLGKADTALQQQDIFFKLDKRGDEMTGLLDAQEGIAAKRIYIYGTENDELLKFSWGGGTSVFSGFDFTLLNRVKLELPWNKPAGNYTIATTSDIPTDATVSGWGYIKSYSESDPTVDGKISTHNSSSSAHADIRNTVNNLADNVSTWSSFWSGDDVRVTVTNYDSAVNLPSLYLEYKLSNGLFRTVWDERTRWNANELRMAALESAVDGKADRAWGYYDSHTGGWAPDGYTWLSSPKIAISGGLAYQKHVTSEGAVWVLESNGLIAESGGVMSNGFFRISDDEGNPLFEIVKGDKRTVGATAGSCEQLAGYAITHLQIGYAVESADHPKIYVARSLTPVEWKDEEDADCPATVNWSGSSGNWTAVVAGKVAEARLFVKAEYEVGGNTYIKQSAPVSVQKLVLGGNEYRVGTAIISGHTVLTLTLEP